MINHIISFITVWIRKVSFLFRINIFCKSLVLAGPRERSPSRKNVVVGELQLEAAIQVSLSESAMDRPRHRVPAFMIARKTPNQVSFRLMVPAYIGNWCVVGAAAVVRYACVCDTVTLEHIFGTFHISRLKWDLVLLGIAHCRKFIAE